MKTLKKIFDSILSMQLVGIAFVIFAFAMGLATFIEHRWGTNAAKVLVYDATWFAVLLSYGCISLVRNVVLYKLYVKGKTGTLLFHLSFILIIIGAGITRYTAIEGSLSIREKESNNVMLTVSNYVSIIHNGEVIKEPKRVLFSQVTPKVYRSSFKVDGKSVSVKSKAYVDNEQHGRVALFAVKSGGAETEVWVPEGAGLQMAAKKVEINNVSFELAFARQRLQIPFDVYLNDFIFERYPGSTNPMAYKSLVTIKDASANVEKEHLIEMNHVLDYKGYRFFQSSYDTDELGTVLSVNKDKPGTNLTYLGYAFLFLGMLWALFDKKSRFRYFTQMAKKSAIAILLMVGLASSSFAADKVDVQDEFNTLWVQGVGDRFQPMSVFADEVLRKMHKARSYDGEGADVIIRGIISNPLRYMKEPVIAIPENPLLSKFNLSGEFAGFLDFYDMETREYLILDEVRRVHALPGNERTKSDREMLNLDERVNIFRMLVGGNFPKMFPSPNSTSENWLTLSEFMQVTDSVSAITVKGFFSTDKQAQKKAIAYIKSYQSKYAGDVLPSNFKQNVELAYFKANVFERLAAFYGLFSVLLLFFIFMSIFSQWGKVFGVLVKGTIVILVIGFAFHTFGLVARGVVSGHMPWSNGYESVVFVAWSSMFAGVIFSRRTPFIPALGALLAAFFMLVSHMSFMNPQITNLVPVLRSYWLTIHVGIITSSYAFLGFGFILGIFNLVLMMFTPKNDTNAKVVRVIKQLYPYSQIVISIGLYLITIGCFLGAIWANQSWGRYWSWDPKETWCLVSIIVYSFLMHMHRFPGFSGVHAFSAGAVVSFATILMTYFGVNYFLGGMHSYAGEGSVTLSVGWYIATAIILVLIVVSGRIASNRKFEELLKKSENF